MADYGITSAGFVRPRLPDIREQIIAALQSNLRKAGLPDNIETRPDSVLGVLIDTFADREAATWEVAEGVYYAMYPGSASGVALDRAVSFSGVTRFLAEPSACRVVLYGNEGTSVPRGTQLRNKVSQNLWQTSQTTSITAMRTADISLSPVLLPNETYSVTVDGLVYSATTPAAPSMQELLAALVASLSASPLDVSSDGASVRLIAYNVEDAAVIPSSNLRVSQLGSPILAKTIDNIAETVAPGDLNTIVTLTDGLTSVNNLVSGAVGRAAETDAELRARYSTGVFRLGAATLPSLAPNIERAVSGVQAVRVLQNDKDEMVNGMLPHSIRIIVSGGVEEDIAKAIYTFKAAGIDTNGAITKLVETAEGSQDISFDRPTPVYIWVKAVITLQPSNEQAFPSNGFDEIATAILATGRAHVIGQDVIAQRFYGGIYQTKGLAQVDLSLAYSYDPHQPPGPDDYELTNIGISDLELALFDASRIKVE